MTSKLLILSLLFLAACGSSNTEANFLCGAEQGQPCRTMSEVDGTAAPQRFAGSATGSPTAAVHTPALTSVATNTVRHPEETGRMWIAPHVVGSGLVHEGSRVRFVVRSARWVTR